MSITNDELQRRVEHCERRIDGLDSKWQGIAEQLARLDGKLSEMQWTFRVLAGAALVSLVKFLFFT